MGDFDSAVGYDEGNKSERKETHDINIEMLGCDYDEFSLNMSKVLKPEDVKPEVIKKAEAFIAETQKRFPDWGFKDPRTCLTYSVWKKLLPEHKLIIIFRNPMKLWQHYKPRKFYKTLNALVVCWKAIRGWYIHNLEILKVLQSVSKEETLVILYSDLMQDDRYFAALSEFTGRKLHDSRNPDLYRNKKEEKDFRFDLMLFIQKSFFGRDVWKLYKDLKKFTLRFKPV